MLCLLDPKRPLSPDILSYFKQATATSSSTEESEPAEVLPQVPVAGLRRKVLGTSKRSGTKMSTHSTRSKGSSVKQQAKSKQPQQHQQQQRQPTIITAFARYQEVVGQKEDGDAEDELLPDNILDNVWDFELSQGQASPVVNEETSSNNGHGLSDEYDITESSQPLLDVEYTMMHTSPKVRGTKRQKSTTVHYSSPIAAKNKKAKLSQAPSATKQQNNQTLPDFSDPFDELAACQARRAKSESSSSSVHIIKHQWVRIDEDDDTTDLDSTLKSTTTVPNTYSTDEFSMALDSLASSSSRQQQEGGCTGARLSTLTSSLKLTGSQQGNKESIETALTAIPTTSQAVMNFTTKEIEDILFGISTPDSDLLSPIEFSETETEKDLASCSLQLVEHCPPRKARRSASQPATHCSFEDQEGTTSSSQTRSESYSDSALETEFKAKFDDITNMVTSPRKGGATSPQKKSDNVSARISIVDLTKTPGTF